MTADRPTNVVVLVLDTARYADVLGSQSAAPFLRDLAAEGTTYDRTFSPAPWTLPAHGSLFTGTYPSWHGAHAGHKALREGPITLAEPFADAGYETVAVSNNTWVSEEFGFGRGFETFHKTWQYVQSDTDLGRIARRKEGAGKVRSLARALFDGNPVVNVANAIYGQFFRKQTDSGARRTNAWIDDWLEERSRDSPFFLFVNYLEPHLEYRPPKAVAQEFLPAGVSYGEAMAVPQDAWGYIAGDVDVSDRDFEILRALYRAEIAYLDERIAELRDHLQAHGEWEDTVIVVTGDHGENVGDHGLMDHQYCLYDTLLHVPLIVAGGAFSGGGTVTNPVSFVDLAPTLLDAAGIDAPEFRSQSQGRSIHPDTAGEPRDAIVAEYMAPQPSMDALESRVGDLPASVERYDRSLRAIRGENWKLIRGSDGTTELYDVADDPAERTDLAADRPEVTERLATDLDDWLSTFEQTSVEGDVDISGATRDRLEDLGYLQ